MTTEDTPRPSSIFFKKLDGPDRWEAWVWTAVGLFVSAAILWIVSYLKLGETSVYTYGVGIPLTAMMAVPIILWGMIKSMLNLPIFRFSRSIGFVLLMVTALAANTPLGPAPVSTNEWSSTHTYRLPFKGPWYALSGGDSLQTNYLATSPAMRFGYAFTKLGPDGSRLSQKDADKLELKSYACFGEPVLAPTKAKVISLLNKEKDHVPGKQGKDNLFGNHVILEVDQNEYLVFAYLKQNSIPLKVGDTVNTGDVIGACGNSGASTYPHVQFYLIKNGKKLVLSEGLPLKFTNFETVDLAGKSLDRTTQGMPVGSGNFEDLKKGQIVQNFEP